MRLLNINSLELTNFNDDKIPAYAILSHRWGNDEVSYEEMRQGRNKASRRYAKLLDLIRAHPSHLSWLWVDTVCIDRGSHAELSEAINSMYQWYQRAAICLAYLDDVSTQPYDGDYPYVCGLPTQRSTEHVWGTEIAQSSWFKRGWTLQELLSPPTLAFLNQDYHVLGHKCTRICACDSAPSWRGPNLNQIIAVSTGIPIDYLAGQKGIHEASIARRMSWAAGKRNAKAEDDAYCLLGIFGVNMPIIYGEGGKAFHRLVEAINMASSHEEDDLRGDIGRLSMEVNDLLRRKPIPRAASLEGGRTTLIEFMVDNGRGHRRVEDRWSMVMRWLGTQGELRQVVHGAYDRKSSQGQSKAHAQDNPHGFSRWLCPPMNISRVGAKRQSDGDGDDDPDERHNQVAKVARTGTKQPILPCIFRAGEPVIFGNHTTLYKHASELMRHLKVHGFYACQKCQTKFPDEASQQAHECKKHCGVRACKRHILNGATAPAKCPCITTSRQQWDGLFRLQYPEKDIPDIVALPRQPIRAETTETSYCFDSIDQFDAESTNSFAVPESTFASYSHCDSAFDFPTISGNMPNGPAEFVNAEMNSLRAELQTLREKVHIYEQRSSLPTDREKELALRVDDLELVLGNVWQTFQNTGHRDSQPDSLTYRLVKRLAPKLVGAEALNQTQAEEPPPLTEPAFDWDSFIKNNDKPGPSTQGDSAYRSMRM